MRSIGISVSAIVVGLLGRAACADSNATVPHIAKHVLPSSFEPPAVFTVSKLERSIDLEKVYIRERWDITIKNTGKASSSEFYVPFSLDELEHIGRFQAREEGPRSPAFEAEPVAREGQSSVEYYRIIFNPPIASKQEKSFRITFNRLAALTPLPKLVDQADKQYLQYTTSAYALSSYPVDSQTLTFVIASGSKFEDFSSVDGVAPKSSPRKLNYGPYKSIKPLTQEPVAVHYEYTRPLTHARLLERDIEVSHWGGNVAFEERYWLENLGAGLKNHYSRLQWAIQMYKNGPTHALRELRIPLRAGSADAYFTDDIGNVSTSSFWSNSRAAELALKPRYPLFGGWKYSFRIGWNAETDKYVRRAKTGSDYILSIPFLEGPKLADGIEYESVQIRAILPEGSRNIKFATSVPLVLNTTSLHSTFMDTVGRPTLTLVARNLVDEVRDASLIITYDLPWGSQYRKPLAIASAVFAVFAAAWVVGNLDTSIGKKAVPAK